MCHDVSIASNIELDTDYLPDLIVDPHLLDIEYEGVMHVEAQANKPVRVVVPHNGEKHYTEFSWGVSARGEDMPNVWNAQSERVLDPSSYWYKIRNNRCLIMVKGVFEHREIKGWKKKVPYHIWLKDRKIFGLPALYDKPNKKSKGRYTVTLLTREAINNMIMRYIHNSGSEDDRFRMPLFLTKDLEILWLREDLTNGEMRSIFSFEMPSEELQYDTVYTIRTNKERPDGKEKLEHYTWQNLPPLGRDTNKLELF